jgi:predicted nicotinamide N-methyase
MERGQFNIYTAAGKALMSLIETDVRIVNILDVGSWNGLGTTLCCVLGAIARVEYKPINVIAIDLNISSTLKNYHRSETVPVPFLGVSSKYQLRDKLYNQELKRGLLILLKINKIQLKLLSFLYYQNQLFLFN